MSTNVIAIVENDQGCLRAVRRLLVARGYGVEAYRSAEEFLAAAPASEAGCALIDIHLGAGLSGLDLACRIRSQERPIPFLLMTASIDASHPVRAAELGCVAFLEKPFADWKLQAALDLALNRSR
jgi:FixJ family two-component response regulator